ncbi:MAG: MFS transporter, partial [Gammaproteobacteria bacterium]|nr:MFS transporter [Gammaproteobacteria bacterium]
MHNWRQQLAQPEMLLYMMAAAVPLSFATWRALINNFAVEQAAFTGIEMGILQSLREIPGFLAFAAVLFLLLFREQTFATLALIVLGIGTALTGFLPSVMGLYFTTVLMSIGFHYAETMQQSLSLQLIHKDQLPVVMGKQMAVGSFTGLFVFAGLYLLLDLLHVDYAWIYLIGGSATVVLAIFIQRSFPHFKGEAEQHKKMILRKCYWLYYMLTFLSGARRQIFVVFAGFLMVEKFDFSAAEITILFLINGVLMIYLAPRIGALVKHWGERRSLTLEYIGLIIIFTSYAFVDNAMIASVLYILDHIFFAMAIALK